MSKIYFIFPNLFLTVLLSMIKKYLLFASSLSASWFLSGQTGTPFWKLYNAAVEDYNCQVNVNNKLLLNRKIHSCLFSKETNDFVLQFPNMLSMFSHVINLIKNINVINVIR